MRDIKRLILSTSGCVPLFPAVRRLLSHPVMIGADNMHVFDKAKYLGHIGNVAAGAASHPCRRYIRGVWWSRKTPENYLGHELRACGLSVMGDAVEYV